jgi:hypothetical protein
MFLDQRRPLYSDNARSLKTRVRSISTKILLISQEFPAGCRYPNRIGSLSVVARYHTPDCTPGDRIQHQLLTAKSATSRPTLFFRLNCPFKTLSLLLFPIPINTLQPNQLTKCSSDRGMSKSEDNVFRESPSWKSNHLYYR